MMQVLPIARRLMHSITASETDGSVRARASRGASIQMRRGADLTVR
jgi:hypothetical protein